MTYKEAIEIGERRLQEAGIADDTLIVMTSDHYPYGLGTAWGNDHNCLAELYGVKSYDEIQRDRNTLIMWSGCLEGKEIQIDFIERTRDIQKFANKQELHNRLQLDERQIREILKNRRDV